MLQIFLQSVVIGYSGAIMPGTLLTYTLEKSIKAGAKAGLMVAVGHVMLEFILVLLIFLGLGKYLDTPTAQITIGILGGAVLILFGTTMLREIYMGKIGINFKGEGGDRFGNILIGGAIVSATNPYFIVWWAAIGLGLILNAYNTFGLIGVMIFYLGHIISDLTWYGLISALIGKTRNFINLRAYKIIIGILGISLIGFGAKFLIASVKLILITS